MAGDIATAEEILNYAVKHGAKFTKVFEQLQRAFLEAKQHDKVLGLFLHVAKLDCLSEFIISTTLLSMIELKKYV
jgi:hypothetical protein